jgi:hypothetical protein
MIKKIVILSIILGFNAALLVNTSAKEDYKVCRGFSPGIAMAFGSLDLGLSEEGAYVGFGWYALVCCKTDTAMGWCDFNLEDSRCKITVKRDANPFCITGTIEE